MVYQSTYRRPKWRQRLRTGLRLFGLSLSATLGVFLCMSENWLGLGIPVLIFTFYRMLKKDEAMVGVCPYCGARIATSAAWAVSCRTCRQRSYVRQGQLLTHPVMKTAVFR